MKNVYSGFAEEQLSVDRKHVWFFAYNLKMQRGTYSVDTDINFYTMSIAINLSGSKKFYKYIFLDI